MPAQKLDDTTIKMVINCSEKTKIEEGQKNFPKRAAFWTGKDAIIRGSDTFF